MLGVDLFPGEPFLRGNGRKWNSPRGRVYQLLGTLLVDVHVDSRLDPTDEAPQAQGLK